MEELCETFDIDPEEQLVETEKKVEETKQQVAELHEAVETKQKYDLQDKEYIRFELQQLITTNNEVLRTLGDMCKAGANARVFEVYSTLSTTVANELKELADINKLITDYQVTEDRENLKKETLELKKELAKQDNAPQVGADGSTYIQNNTYNFTSKDMLDLINKLDLPKKEVTEADLPKFDLE